MALADEQADLLALQRAVLVDDWKLDDDENLLIVRLQLGPLADVDDVFQRQRM